MHSYHYTDKKTEEEVNFHFDGGLTGDLIICKDNTEIRLPAKAILELVAYEYILPKKIGKLEAAEIEELLD